MTTEPKTATCPRCGETTSGRYCAGCGAASHDVACPACGTAAPAGARFCPECGATIGAGASARHNATVPSARLPLVVGGAALLTLVAFVAGVATGRRSGIASVAFDQPALAPSADATPAGLGGGGIVAAPDISNMSPEERASRLFNRVMLYSEQGKLDSARFFAPMAIQAYEMIGPVDAHAQYDIGTISAAAGDLVRARAEADTILTARPNHLLGLVLAIRAADMAKDAGAASAFRKRLVAAAPTERSALKEYSEHARDIDDALAKSTVAAR